MTKTLITIFFTYLLSGIICAQNLHVLKSTYLPVDDSLIVFTPENYNYQQNYPLVILLHGYSGNYKTWSKFTPLQEYANKYQFIIACPDGIYDSWYINSPINDSLQYENFFFMRLLPFLFKSYSIDNKNIFLTGLSMGGYGSLYLYTTHPKIFKSVGSTSGLIIPNDFKKHYGIEKVMGIYTPDFSIINSIQAFKKIKRKPIIDCGTEDPFYKQNLELKKQLDNNKIAVNFVSIPGAHNREYWKTSIIKHLEYFNSLINK